MIQILIIDQCPAFRRLARCILERDGFDVIEAGDGLAGMQRAIEDAPDLILIDLNMSGLPGDEICRRLSNEEQTREIPIVIGSSSSHRVDPADRLRAKTAGAAAQINRPHVEHELPGCVRRLLGDAPVDSLVERAAADSTGFRLAAQTDLASVASHR